MYYNPETIPEEYRKPYAQKGIHPESDELLEKGGSHSSFNNALLENEPRSGVLAAVEDFMDTAGQALELLKLPGINGLGILFSSSLKERNEALAGFLYNLDFSEAAVRQVELVERFRVNAQVQMQEEKKRRKRAEKRLQQLEDERQRQRCEMDEMKSSGGWEIAKKINIVNLKLRGLLRKMKARK